MISHRLKPINCICGKEPDVFSDCAGFYTVECEDQTCWQGASKPSRREAIRCWNYMMLGGKDVERAWIMVNVYEINNVDFDQPKHRVILSIVLPEMRLALDGPKPPADSIGVGIIQLFCQRCIGEIGLCGGFNAMPHIRRLVHREPCRTCTFNPVSIQVNALDGREFIWPVRPRKGAEHGTQNR